MADDQKPATMNKAQAGSGIYKSAAGEREVKQRPPNASRRAF